jgi:hypothetical protein
MSVACVSREVADRLVGAAGGATGVELASLDPGPSPARFTAVTT